MVGLESTLEKVSLGEAVALSGKICGAEMLVLVGGLSVSQVLGFLVLSFLSLAAGGALIDNIFVHRRSEEAIQVVSSGLDGSHRLPQRNTSKVVEFWDGLTVLVVDVHLTCV